MWVIQIELDTTNKFCASFDNDDNNNDNAYIGICSNSTQDAKFAYFSNMSL